MPSLLLFALSVAEFLPRRPAESGEKNESVESQMDRLKGIVEGLGSVRTTQKDTEFSKVLAPYVDAMSGVLKDVNNSKKPLTEEEKKKRLDAAQHSMEQLANDMAKFGQKLIDDDQKESTSILLGVLLSRKDEPMEKQMEVLTDKQFQHLKVVQYLLKHRTSAPLVEQVAAYLDHKKDPAGTETEAKAKASKLITKFLTRAENALKTTKSLQSKQVLEEEIRHLKRARLAVDKGDLAALRKVQSEMEKMQAKIHQSVSLVQLVSFTRSSRDCPYCKAQCIEKCHNNGQSFMECIGSCAEEGSK